MTVAEKPQADDVMSSDAGHRDHSRQTGTQFAAPPAVSPELVSRFHALIDEVTKELMQGKDLDRLTCRADAIALLVATSDQIDSPPEGGESPLRYLLLEEQQKAAAALGGAGAAGQVLTFLKLC